MSITIQDVYNPHAMVLLLILYYDYLAILRRFSFVSIHLDKFFNYFSSLLIHNNRKFLFCQR